VYAGLCLAGRCAGLQKLKAEASVIGKAGEVHTLAVAESSACGTRRSFVYWLLEPPGRTSPLLDQITAPLASLTGDGAYDQAGIYDTVGKRHPDADVIVPPRSTAVLSENVEATPTQCDRHLQSIHVHGRRGWQKRSGYARRALVETAMSRLKRVIGDASRSRTDRRRTTEVAIAVHALNRMLELGCPRSICIA
jgi:hypothetical protein